MLISSLPKAGVHRRAPAIVTYKALLAIPTQDHLPFFKERLLGRAPAGADSGTTRVRLHPRRELVRHYGHRRDKPQKENHSISWIVPRFRQSRHRALATWVARASRPRVPSHARSSGAPSLGSTQDTCPGGVPAYAGTREGPGEGSQARAAKVGARLAEHQNVPNPPEGGEAPRLHPPSLHFESCTNVRSGARILIMSLMPQSIATLSVFGW